MPRGPFAEKLLLGLRGKGSRRPQLGRPAPCRGAELVGGVPMTHWMGLKTIPFGVGYFSKQEPSESQWLGAGGSRREAHALVEVGCFMFSAAGALFHRFF